MRTHRWFLKSLIILPVCFAFLPSSLAQEKLPAIVKRIEPSTVLILTYDKEGKILAQGSGFFINQNGDVITNRHVLQGASRAEVKTAEGEVYPITQIVAEDVEGDIIRASVDIPPKVAYPLPVSTSIPEVGERVIVIGSPLGLEQTVADGIVSAVREIPAFGKIIQITASISPGSSGSPVVNMQGKVIGVATFQIVEGQSLNFAIPGERVAKLTPGKRRPLAEWQMGRAEEWHASAEALCDTGFAVLWTGNYEKALPYFEKVAEKDPQDAIAYFVIGYCNDQLGRYTEAIFAYKRGISIKPDYAEAHFGLGSAYWLLGRRTEAIGAFKQAIRIKPDYAKAHCGLGITYNELGRYTEAIEAYKQAIRINPDLALAHYGLGLNYLILGDRGSALDEYKILKGLDKDLANTLFNLIYE